MLQEVKSDNIEEANNLEGIMDTATIITSICIGILFAIANGIAWSGVFKRKK